VAFILGSYTDFLNFAIVISIPVVLVTVSDSFMTDIKAMRHNQTQGGSSKFQGFIIVSVYNIHTVRLSVCTLSKQKKTNAHSDF